MPPRRRGPPVAPARTWLATVGWRRSGGPITSRDAAHGPPSKTARPRRRMPIRAGRGDPEEEAITASVRAPRAAASSVPGVVHEGLHLGREVPRARIHHVDRCRRRVPVAQNALEPARTQFLHAAKRRKKRDASRRSPLREERRMSLDHQARGDSATCADSSPRFRGAAVLDAGAEEQAVVFLQIVRGLGTAALLEVRGRRDEEPRHACRGSSRSASSRRACPLGCRGRSAPRPSRPARPVQRSSIRTSG